MKQSECSEKLKFCPDCRKSEQKSVVRLIGVENVVLGELDAFHDEEGKYHHHNEGGTDELRYKCSNGHTWTEEDVDDMGPCWCGWPEVKEDD